MGPFGRHEAPQGPQAGRGAGWGVSIFLSSEGSRGFGSQSLATMPNTVATEVVLAQSASSAHRGWHGPVFRVPAKTCVIDAHPKSHGPKPGHG